MNEETEIILARYFSGEATEKEQHTLDAWLAESNENEKQFQQISLLYQYVGQKNDMPVFDTEKAFVKFKNYMWKKQTATAVEPPSNRTEGRKQKAEKEGMRSSRFFYGSKIWRIAAAITLLIMGTFVLLYFTNQPSQTVHLVAVETEQKFTLFENAEVILFPGTEIIYHTPAKGEVLLKGKAMFTVTSNTSVEGIIVQAGETFIKDIGTVFLVDATAPEISITVNVTEGEVWFYTENNQGVHVNANKGAVYDVGTKQFSMISTVGALYAKPLPDNQLPEIIFKNTPLFEAIDIIKTRYGVNIVVRSNELNEVLLNTSFDNNESVEYILEIIAATISAKLLKQSDGFIILLQN